MAMLLCKSVPIRSLLYSTFYFIFHLSCFNSFVFSLLITLDRYAAICHPYRYLEYATCRRYAYTAIAIFLLSAIYAKIEITHYQNHKVIFWSFEVSLQLLFIILVLMIYIKIYKVVLLQRKRIAMSGNFTSRRQSRIPAGERSRTHTVTIILGVFIACYTPFTVYYLMFTLQLLEKIKAYNLYELGIWAYYFVLLNSCLNPIIYCARSQEIRRAALGIFVPSFAHRSEQNSGNTASNADINTVDLGKSGLTPKFSKLKVYQVLKARLWKDDDLKVIVLKVLRLIGNLLPSVQSLLISKFGKFGTTNQRHPRSVNANNPRLRKATAPWISRR